jgi:hypothetical protein
VVASFALGYLAAVLFHDRITYGTRYAGLLHRRVALGHAGLDLGGGVQSILYAGYSMSAPPPSSSADYRVTIR